MTKTKKNTRNPNGEGTFYKEEARERWCAIIPNPDGGKPFTKKSKNKELVRTWYIEKLDEIKKKIQIAPNSWTVESWANTYIEDYINITNLRQRTKEDYKSSILATIKPYGNLKLQEVTTDHIERQLLSRTNMADSTIKKEFNLVSRMFRQARKRRLIYRNPCDDIEELPKGAGIVRPPRVGEEKDVIQILEAAKKEKNPIAYPAILLLFSAAIRRSELLGLRWQDINFQKQTIFIEQTVQITKDGLKIEKPKTKSGTREIAVNKAALDALLVLKKERNNPPLVFTTKNGTAIHPRNFSRLYDKVEQLGGGAISLHGARHTIASILAKKNVSASELAAFLGHASASFTMNRYVHPARKANHELASIVSASLQEKTESEPAENGL